MKDRITLDIELIRSHMNYNKDTGELTWTKNFFKTKIGKRVGCLSRYGYYKVTFKKQTLLCHRVCWALHYNEQPPEIIDHINGIRTDNRIDNLRGSTTTENAENQRGAMRSNRTSRFLGVSKFKGRWRAKIKAKGKYVFLGYHDTEELARDAYIKAKRELHDGCEI